MGGMFLTEAARNWSDEQDGTASAAAVLEPALDCEVAPLVVTDAEPGTQVLKVPVAPLAHPRDFGVVVGEDLAGVVAGIHGALNPLRRGLGVQRVCI